MSDPFDDLDAITTEIVGEAITYTPAGGAAVQIKAFINYAPEIVDFGTAATAVSDSPSMQVLISTVPVISNTDRFYLPRTATTYRPKAWPRSKCGRLWNVELAKAL